MVMVVDEREDERPDSGTRDVLVGLWEVGGGGGGGSGSGGSGCCLGRENVSLIVVGRGWRGWRGWGWWVDNVVGWEGSGGVSVGVNKQGRGWKRWLGLTTEGRMTRQG
jgi:hypothetical protein